VKLSYTGKVYISFKTQKKFPNNTEAEYLRHELLERAVSHFRSLLIPRSRILGSFPDKILANVISWATKSAFLLICLGTPREDLEGDIFSVGPLKQKLLKAVKKYCQLPAAAQQVNSAPNSQHNK